MGFANELFTPHNAGTDLKQVVLCMMNQTKTQQIFPVPLQYCNITSLYKQKGKKQDFNNYRGIFRVTIIRSILDKLIYNDEFDNIDKHLTDSNVGARRGRNIRDNIFILGAISNEIVTLMSQYLMLKNASINFGPKNLLMTCMKMVLLMII